MLDEEMDHIIREAAEKHHPAYNDKAWEMMEKKLDKHLPQKKDRRREIFFLLFFLLLGAGIVFTVSRFNKAGKPATENNSLAANGSSQPVPATSTSPGNGDEAGSTAQQHTGTAGADAVNNTPAAATGIGGPAGTNAGTRKTETEADKNDLSFFNGNNNVRKTYTGKTRVRISNPGLQQDATTATTAATAATADATGAQSRTRSGKTAGKQTVKISNAAAEEDNDNTTAAENNTGKTATADVPATDKTRQDESKLTAKEEEPKKTEQKTAEKKPAEKNAEKSTASTDKKKTKNKAGSNFGLTASIGPDMSFVKLNNTGRTTLTYGAGLSYDISKRFNVRAGFYVSKKVYTAAPDEYHSPGGNYPNLTGVDADCKVYEIPVSVSYKFGERNKHNWFGGAGLSSFIMKKEDYTYNYKSPAGQTYEYYQHLRNRNKHYFAVLTLSAGYNYQLSNRLSVQAEPYAKIPLGGVGQGKIKLNSAGVLFTLTYKPFKKKK